MSRLSRLAWQAWLPIAVVVTWWIASEGSTSPFFPPLRTIVTTFRETWLFDRAGTDFVPFLLRFAGGFALAVVIGISLGLVLGQWAVARRSLMPSLDFLRAVPATVLIPAAILLLGTGDWMKIGIIAKAATFPILLNTIDGVRSIEPAMLDFARAYRLRPHDRLVRIIIPSASPQIFSGMRLSLAVALILTVVAEWLASADGLGFYILYTQQTFRIPEMWSGIVLLGITGYAINFLFVLGERKILAWHRGWRASIQGAGR